VVFEVLTAVVINSSVFLVITPRIPLTVSRRFGGTGFNFKVWGIAFFGSEEARVTTCIMRIFRRDSLCYWSAVDCDGRATVVEVGWRRCCLEDCWECLLFTGARSMGCAVQWSPMKPGSELIRLVPTKVFADLLLLLVTLQLTENAL
jgi:hypothetical protein